MPSDFLVDLIDHKRRVGGYLQKVANALFQRAVVHDNSKFSPEEYEPYEEAFPGLQKYAYGTDEFRAELRKIKPAIQHHYENNDHHPEHAKASGEQWLPIPDYEGYCEVSNFGEVRSIERVVERPAQGNFTKPRRILKPHLTPKGYARLQLSRDGQVRNHLIHRLVAQAFILNPGNLPEVNHKNGIKTDNRVENLEWITSSDNQEHAYETGLRQPVTKYVVHCEELDITTFGTNKMAEALRGRGHTTANSGAIWNCIQGDSTSHLGLTFTSSNIADYQSPSPLESMDLLDLIEMVCDWKAASERSQKDIFTGLEMNRERFKIDDQLYCIIKNTIIALTDKE